MKRKNKKRRFFKRNLKKMNDSDLFLLFTDELLKLKTDILSLIGVMKLLGVNLSDDVDVYEQISETLDNFMKLDRKNRIQLVEIVQDTNKFNEEEKKKEEKRKKEEEKVEEKKNDK